MSNNEINYQIARDNDMWNKIESLNWYDISESINPNQLLTNILIAKFSLDEIIEMQQFVINKRIYLRNLFKSYYKASAATFKHDYKGSDDITCHIISHIIGMGQMMYRYVTDHLDMFIFLQHDYVENFEYGFKEAIQQLQQQNNSMNNENNN